MGRGGDGLKRRGRAQAAQARTRGCCQGLGTAMGQGGQEDRLAEADAAAGVRGSASAVGGGAHLLLVRAEQEDEQGLREALRERGGVRLRGNDTAHGEAIGTWLRISKQFLRDCLKIPDKPHCGLSRVLRTQPGTPFHRLACHQTQRLRTPLAIFQTVSPRTWVNSGASTPALSCTWWKGLTRCL